MAVNTVTVSTSGSVGPAGINWKNTWATSTAYATRDTILYSVNGNCYICTVAHTSSGSILPTNTSYWNLFANVGEGFQWGNTALHTQYTDSLNNVGYSALHHALKSKDWATKVDGEVTSDANASLSPDGFSAKAYAIGGTGVDNVEGSAKDWAIETGSTPSSTATDASAKEWAIGTSTHNNDGSAKDWAIYTSGDIRGGSAGDMSAKEWAVGIQGRGVAGEGSAKDWAVYTGDTVDGTNYSAKYWSTTGNVATVSGNIADINTVAGISGNVTSVAGKATEVGRLGTADAVSDLNTLGTADAVSDMNTLAAISANVTTVAGISSDVTTVAGKSTEVGLLGTSAMAHASTGHLSILGVSGVVTNIGTVSGISGNVTTVAGTAGVSGFAGFAYNF